MTSFPKDRRTVKLDPPRWLVCGFPFSLLDSVTEAALPVVLLNPSMLLPRLGVLGSFAFHGLAAVRRVNLPPSSALRATPPSSWHHLSRFLQRTRARSNTASSVTRMSSTAGTSSTKQHKTDATQILAGVRELCDKYDGFILDQFGVLHDGRDALPGAVECLEELRRNGKRLVILSNTSKREAFTMNRLPKYGFSSELFDGGVTSGEEGYQYMVGNGLVGGKAVLLGWNGEDTDGFLKSLALDYSSPQEAAFLVCHGPDTIVDDTGTTRTGTRNSGEVEPYEALFQAAMERNLPMYNVNPDVTVNNPGGGVWYMPGLLSKKYEAMGGRVKYFGKPHKEHYEAAVAKMGLAKERVIHVGDSLAHDIVGAASSGLDSLFIAGGIHGAELGVDARDGKPPFEISTEVLQTLFVEEGVTPTWTLPRFEL